MIAEGIALLVAAAVAQKLQNDWRPTTISQEGINLIKLFEGLRLTAYRDSVGVLTIGYGHTGADVTENLTITEAQAEQILIKDLQTRVAGVKNLIGNLKITQHQFDALVSFAFNLGLNNLKNSTLLSLVKNNPKNTSIYNQFLAWNKAGGVVLVGLTKRRNAEATLYFT
jgi:lysozyme